MDMVGTQAKTVTFYSKSMGLRLVRKRDITNETALGFRQKVQEEVVVDFGEDGPGPLGQFLVEPGVGVMVDEDGQERDTLTWLREHPEYNLRFFEMGNEPDLLRPTPEEFNGALVDAMAEADEDAIRELVDAERNSHNRDDLIVLAERALERMGAETHSVVSGDQGS
jgi:catechol 2,3-dioxygenase-like lactoylglutathione lyase family enzyme